MTDSRRPVADVHIADWFLAALDAVEPVLMVIGTSVKLFRVFIQRLGQKFLGLGFDHTATHMDGAFLAFESRAAFEFSRTAAASNYNAGGVVKADIKPLRSAGIPASSNPMKPPRRHGCRLQSVLPAPAIVS